MARLPGRASWWPTPARGSILDTETTGLDSGDEIIQIAILNPEGEVLLDELVKPYVEITAEAESVNGISPAMVADKPGFAAIAGQVFEILGARRSSPITPTLTAGCFTRPAPGTTSARDVFALDWSDAMIAYSRYYGEWSDYWHDFKWQSLWGGDHTAKGDCLATLKRIQDMATSNLSGEKRIG